MAPPHRAKPKKKLKHQNFPVPAAPKGPTRTYTISKSWSPVGSGSNIKRTKSRITSICRTLTHKGGEKALPGYKRVELERELKALRSEEAVSKAEVRRQAVMRQDKRVKFFGGASLACSVCEYKLISRRTADCQKAKRRLKNARKALESANDEDKTSVEERMRILDVDLHYTLYYPLGTPYVPLYPRKDDDEKEEDINESTLRGDAQMRKRIETAMNEGKSSLVRLKNELTVNEIMDEELGRSDQPTGRNDSGANEDGNDFFE
jgi:rRNA-processing protein Efg1